ncbi:MAG: hypothetical protein IKB23_00140 [Clostridia bacterium]|nr:hypothetical protein [Clostridia bacterium]
MKTKLLALLLLVAMTLTMVSCAGRPKLNIDKAKDNLEDNGYIVVTYDDLTIGVEEVLSASNGDDSLYIGKFDTAKMAKLEYNQLKEKYDYEIKALKLEIKEVKYILKKYKNELKSDEIDYYEDRLKDLQEELEEMKKDYVFGISGKTVWYGTADAAKDSRR